MEGGNRIANKWRNLAPHITRQRVVIECTTEKLIGRLEIEEYLTELAKLTKMTVVSGPFSYEAEGLGFGAWVHWRTSGAHVYSYTNDPFGTGIENTKPLLTIDAYTCKPFDAKKAAEFTAKYFDAIDFVWKEV